MSANAIEAAECKHGRVLYVPTEPPNWRIYGVTYASPHGYSIQNAKFLCTDCREWIPPGEIHHKQVVNTPLCTCALPHRIPGPYAVVVDPLHIDGDHCIDDELGDEGYGIDAELFRDMAKAGTLGNVYTTPVTYLCLICGVRWITTFKEIDDERSRQNAEAFKDRIIGDWEIATRPETPKEDKPSLWWRFLRYWNIYRRG